MQDETTDKAGNSDASGEKQVVYMMPAPDLEEDEIDLWQLILPLIRYKLQILIFLFIGLAVGIGYPMLKTRQTEATVPSSEALASRIQNTENRLQREKAALASQIQSIPDGKTIERAVSVELRFSSLDNPSSVRTIRLHPTFPISVSSADMHSPNSEILVITQSETTEAIKRQLAARYDELFSLENEITALALDSINRGLETLKARENPDISPVQPLEEKTRERDLFLAETERFNQSLVESIRVEIPSNRIPLHFWQVLRKQEGTDNQQLFEGIHKQATSVLSLYTDARQAKALHILSSEDETTLKRMRQLPYVQGFILAPAAAPPSINRKVLWISLVIALFLGIFSVYVRVLLSQMARNKEMGRYRQEFFDALKTWKL